MPENEVVASFLYLQKLWNTRLYMNLRMTEKVCCFENVCHVWLWNFPSESAMVQQLLPFKLLHKRTTKRKQRIFTTSMEFWPKVATKSSTERRFVRFNLDGAIWGGRFFWGEDGHVFKRNDEQDEQLVWGDSHQQVLNDQLFWSLPHWFLEVCHGSFFLSKENLKNWFGFSLFGYFVCNSMCSSFPGTL